ncbi:MAG: thiolase family protein, partial [Gammaproteobacteria bacterium]|nr:thiolase family protein [Gammaproteobacteria bacterium]
ETSEINEAFLGQCRQAGHGPNPARTAILWGGLPESTPATTINMACPSGMIAIRTAMAQYKNTNSLLLVGGLDSMSTIPYLLKNARFQGFKMGNRVLEDGWSDSIDPVVEMNMGQTAENLVDKYGFTRDQLDKYAVLSQQRSSNADRQGYYKNEIAAVLDLENDEPIRHNIDPAKMAQLPAVFRKGGIVTAGNACTMADAAAMIIIAPKERFPQQAAFRVLDQQVTAVDPALMGIGPAVAIKELLKKNGLTKNDIELLEINEAFAVQMLVNIQDLDWDPEKVNLWGGAIALGHPTGMSGARIVITLMRHMKTLDKTLAIAAICGAGGVTSAMLIERVR